MPLSDLVGFSRQTQPALLVLADGSVFHGQSMGALGAKVGEVVFNTAISGYQEILTDPSYCQQIVTLTYPHIGNVGVNPEDVESGKIWASGLVVRDCSIVSSNFRAKQDLSSYLKEFGVVGITGVDTRRLTRVLRKKGAQNGCLMAGEVDLKKALAMAQAAPTMMGLDLAQEVTCAQPYAWQGGAWQLPAERGQKDFSTLKNANSKNFRVIVYDYGVKQNILRLLVERGCRVTVVPATTPASEVLAMQPDGVFCSNGPGDPEACTYAIDAIAEILGQRIPIFGICLGHQLLALASGAKTHKMKFGHHGANHPVLDYQSGRVLITSQNHGFAVASTSLPSCLRVTHASLFDQTIQGIERTDCPAFGFQGHPEASPGPHDAGYLFDRFIQFMADRA